MRCAASSSAIVLAALKQPINVAAFRGFTPYDICGQLRRASDRALFQIDMIFVRKESALREHRRFSMFEPTDERAPT